MSNMFTNYENLDSTYVPNNRNKEVQKQCILNYELPKEIYDSNKQIIGYYDNNKLVALTHNEELISVENMTPYVLKDFSARFLWEVISLQYGEFKPGISGDSQMLRDFVKASKRVDFSRLLSHLKYNLYIPSNGPKIKKQYAKLVNNINHDGKPLDSNMRFFDIIYKKDRD